MLYFQSTSHCAGLSSLNKFRKDKINYYDTFYLVKCITNDFNVHLIQVLL